MKQNQCFQRQFPAQRWTLLSRQIWRYVVNFKSFGNRHRFCVTSDNEIEWHITMARHVYYNLTIQSISFDLTSKEFCCCSHPTMVKPLRMFAFGLLSLFPVNEDVTYLGNLTQQLIHSVIYSFLEGFLSWMFWLWTCTVHALTIQ